MRLDPARDELLLPVLISHYGIGNPHPARQHESSLHVPFPHHECSGGGVMSHLTAAFEQADGWWIAYIEELPGVNTQGRTLEEARENLREATRLVLEAN